jgi:hypothetical protein
MQQYALDSRLRYRGKAWDGNFCNSADAKPGGSWQRYAPSVHVAGLLERAMFSRFEFGPKLECVPSVEPTPRTTVASDTFLGTPYANALGVMQPVESEEAAILRQLTRHGGPG